MSVNKHVFFLFVFLLNVYCFESTLYFQITGQQYQIFFSSTTTNSTIHYENGSGEIILEDDVQDFAVQIGIPDSGAATFYYLPQTYVKIYSVATRLTYTCTRIERDSFQDCNCSSCPGSQFTITNYN